MSENITVTPAQYGVAGAVLGTGIGYFAAPPKYNLVQLIKQEPDIFQRTFPESIRDSLPQQKPAILNIEAAQTKFRKAINEGRAKQVVNELLQDKDLQADYKSIKKLLPKARENSAVIWAILIGFLAIISKIAFGKDS